MFSDLIEIECILNEIYNVDIQRTVYTALLAESFDVILSVFYWIC